MSQRLCERWDLANKRTWQTTSFTQVLSVLSAGSHPDIKMPCTWLQHFFYHIQSLNVNDVAFYILIHRPGRLLVLSRTTRDVPKKNHRVNFKMKMKKWRKPPLTNYCWWKKILHHLECIKPCKWWDKLLINRCRISSINSIANTCQLFYPDINVQCSFPQLLIYRPALCSQWPKSLPHWATSLPELAQSSSKQSAVLKVAYTWLSLIIIRLGSRSNFLWISGHSIIPCTEFGKKYLQVIQLSRPAHDIHLQCLGLAPSFFRILISAVLCWIVATSNQQNISPI